MKNLKYITLKNLLNIKQNNYMGLKYPYKKYNQVDVDYEIKQKTKNLYNGPRS